VYKRQRGLGDVYKRQAYNHAQINDVTRETFQTPYRSREQI
jgi:hypothetical protein